MANSLSKLLKLPLSQQVTVALAWLLFISWHIKIRYFPYRWWRKAVNAASDIQPQADIHLRAMQVVSLSEKAGRHHVVPINCLRRCMVQKQLLRWHKINSQLSIGVKKDQGQFAAHCWLVVNNHIINDSPSETARYVELKRLQSGDTQDAALFKGLV